MTLAQMIVLILVVIFILLLILFPDFRKLCMGWTRLFIKDMATTPEGAEAIYEEKIEEAQNNYNKADNALRVATGRYNNTQDELKHLRTQLTQIEKACEALVQKGDIDNAKIKVEQREAVISDISRKEELLKAFATAKLEAEQVHTHCQKQLAKLKRESKEVVENMKVKKQLQEVYDDMDELKNVTATDKLLEQVKEKNKDLNASVEGARAIHNNKLSTKIQKADDAAKKAQSNDYLESLRKKYNK